eukprot:4745404-Heterocapsa_arctica.AAC.1
MPTGHPDRGRPRPGPQRPHAVAGTTGGARPPDLDPPNQCPAGGPPANAVPRLGRPSAASC